MSTKADERELYTNLSLELDRIEKAVHTSRYPTKTSERLTRVIDMISSMHLSSNRKSRLISKIQSISGKLKRSHSSPASSPGQRNSNSDRIATIINSKDQAKKTKKQQLRTKQRVSSQKQTEEVQSASDNKGSKHKTVLFRSADHETGQNTVTQSKLTHSHAKRTHSKHLAHKSSYDNVYTEESMNQETSRITGNRASENQNRWVSSSKGLAQLHNGYQNSRELEIKNQMLEQQVETLKQRIRRLRQLNNTQIQEYGEGENRSVNMVQYYQLEASQVREKLDEFSIRVEELTRQNTEKDRKIEELKYNNQKLLKLLKVKDNQVKRVKQQADSQINQLKAELKKLRKFQIQAKAFQVSKQSIGVTPQLKQIIQKYKEVIRQQPL